MGGFTRASYSSGDAASSTRADHSPFPSETQRRARRRSRARGSGARRRGHGVAPAPEQIPRPGGSCPAGPDLCRARALHAQGRGDGTARLSAHGVRGIPATLPRGGRQFPRRERQSPRADAGERAPTATAGHHRGPRRGETGRAGSHDRAAARGKGGRGAEHRSHRRGAANDGRGAPDHGPHTERGGSSMRGASARSNAARVSRCGS